MRMRLVVALSVVLFLGGGEAAAQARVALPAPPTPLPAGSAIKLSDCGFAYPHAGQTSGQYMVDRDAYYASTFLPTDIPGGHFEVRGTYPYARWFSFEAYDEGLASQDVADDSIIDPNPGSTNPFAPGAHRVPGHASYKLDIYTVPPDQRANPHPHNVLYMGYRENPTYGNLEHSPYSPILYRVYLGQHSYQGGVPVPQVYWVVDNAATNPFQNQAEVCAAEYADGGGVNQEILALNQTLNDRFTQPTLSPAEQNVDIPTDDAPTDPPGINVIRPATNGYQGAYFNSRTPYTFIRPSAIYGRFLVVHFKAPTFSRIDEGIPATGHEQTVYWSWCAAQFVSPVNITKACIPDERFHIEDGYATMVISPSSQRPKVHGRPYPDWMAWPGGGTDLNMREIDPNPVNFHQSPFFIPTTSSNDGLDYLLDIPFESEIKQWMGPYFPTVSYCTTRQFDKNGCGWSAALQFRTHPSASQKFESRSSKHKAAPRHRRTNR